MSDLAISNKSFATDGEMTAAQFNTNMTDIENWCNGSGNINTARLANGAVTEAKLADSAVSTAKIKDENVTEAKLADDSVSARTLKDGSVTGGKIGAGAVTATKIGSNAVETDKIKAGAVTSTKIGSNAVETTKIKDNNVTPAKINSDSGGLTKVSGGKIANHANGLTFSGVTHFKHRGGGSGTSYTFEEVGPSLFCAADFRPATSNTYKLGISTNYWNQCHAGNFYGTYNDIAEYCEVAPEYKLSKAELETLAKLETRSKFKDDPEGKEKETQNLIEKERFSKIKSGTVVVITDKGIAPSSKKDDTKFKGVVSMKPTFIAGSQTKGIPVAMKGMVPCFVVGSGSAGDMLTTSATEGCAEVTTTPVLGAVVGKLEHDKESEAKQLVEIWV